MDKVEAFNADGIGQCGLTLAGRSDFANPVLAQGGVMEGISFEDWWNTEPHPEIEVDKTSAEKIWEAAQRHYQDELQRSVFGYKTLAAVANGLRAFLEEHVPGSVFVTANGQWVFKAFCDELDYVNRELGDKQ